MPKVITKEDVKAAMEKAAAKAKATEQRRCIKAVKSALLTLPHIPGSDRIFVRGARSFMGAAIAAIKEES